MQTWQGLDMARFIPLLYVGHKSALSKQSINLNFDELLLLGLDCAVLKPDSVGIQK